MSDQSPKVITRSVASLPNYRRFTTVGTGQARRSVDLYPQVAEMVLRVNFSAGEQVEKGAVLAQLDNRAEQLALSLAKTRLKEAKNLLKRYEQAGQQGAVPQSEVDAARADYEVAAVALKQARLALSYRQIRAPFDGFVGLTSFQPGDQVTTSSLFTTLDDRSAIEINFEVPEAIAGALLANPMDQAVTVTTPALPDRTFTGRIAEIDSRISPTRRTLKVKALIDNEDDQLRPGMSFRTEWQADGATVPAVPEIAIQWNRDGGYVWLVDNGIARKTPVTILARRNGMALLDGDLGEGMTVVVEGVQRLRHDQPVTILGQDQ